MPVTDELFKCVVRTSYNRCVVSVFGYHVSTGKDDDDDEEEEEEVVTWQDEEVAWGEYVPYDVVGFGGRGRRSRIEGLVETRDLAPPRE